MGVADEVGGETGLAGGGNGRDDPTVLEDLDDEHVQAPAVVHAYKIPDICFQTTLATAAVRHHKPNAVTL